MPAPPLIERLRVLLVLGRISNLPTVWSNCLAAWILSGGGPLQPFLLLCLGATFLYTGGMFLNDAFDVEFDRKYRAERPIISGQVSLRFVWIAGGALLCLGWFALFRLSARTATFGGLLLICIITYNAVHKSTSLAPLLMAGCRFLLYLVAGSAAQAGAGSSVIWFASALLCYIVGLSYLARVESTAGIVSHWPAFLLLLPLVFAISYCGKPGAQLWAAVSIQALWVLWCLSGGYSSAKRFLSSGVAGLLAGIPLVDWLAVSCRLPVDLALAFPAFLLLALLLQRVAPAT